MGPLMPGDCILFWLSSLDLVAQVSERHWHGCSSPRRIQAEGPCTRTFRDDPGVAVHHMNYSLNS